MQISVCLGVILIPDYLSGFPFRLFCSQEQNSQHIFRNIPNERASSETSNHLPGSAPWVSTGVGKETVSASLHVHLYEIYLQVIIKKHSLIRSQWLLEHLSQCLCATYIATGELNRSSKFRELYTRQSRTNLPSYKNFQHIWCQQEHTAACNRFFPISLPPSLFLNVFS